jgi:hypothetical protein
METTATFLGAFIIVAIIGLIAGGIAAAFWLSKRSARARTEMAQQMAFQPLADTAELLERVRLLYGRGPQRRLQIEYAYWRKLGEATFHWFSMVDQESSGDEGSSWMGENLVLAQSPALNTPRLSIFATPKLTGLAGDMAKRIIQMGFNYAIGRSGMARVEFLEDSDFEDRFLVGGQHEGAVRTFLDDERRGRLVGMPFSAVHIEAGRDLLWVQPINITSTEKIEPAERLRQMIEMTQRVMVIFGN